MRGALVGATAGLIGTFLALRIDDLRVGDEPAVCLFGLLLGLGAGLALGAGAGRGRFGRLALGFVAAPAGFLALSLGVWAVTGHRAWDDWPLAVFLLLRGPLGLARELAVAGLALGAGELAAGALARDAGPLERAARTLAVGATAALLAGIAFLAGLDGGLVVWIHVVALVPVAGAASLAWGHLLRGRRT